MPGCECDVCLSDDPKNKRLRASAYVEFTDADGKAVRILIDTTPDLRTQALRDRISGVEAVLYTHIHSDHVNGIDDLRSFNFINKTTIDIYASDATATELERRFAYVFYGNTEYEGGATPNVKMHRIMPNTPFQVRGLEVIPLQVLHGRMEVFGYRFGDFAYITDCSHIPEETHALLAGLDVLVLDGLRYRPHNTHFTHEQAVREIERINPRRAFLTHISHDIDHNQGNAHIRFLTNGDVSLGYDQLAFEL